MEMCYLVSLPFYISFHSLRDYEQWNLKGTHIRTAPNISIWDSFSHQSCNGQKLNINLQLRLEKLPSGYEIINAIWIF